eukprot:4197092-Alexandrium_andersonii.AAC.1
MPTTLPANSPSSGPPRMIQAHGSVNSRSAPSAASVRSTSRLCQCELLGKEESAGQPPTRAPEGRRWTAASA